MFKSLYFAVLCMGLLLAGGSYAAQNGNAEVNQQARKLLPAKYLSNNVLNAVTDPGSPPYSFLTPSGEYTGLEYDLLKEVTQRLGLTLKVSKTKFASIIPAIQAGRYDLVYIALGDKSEREKVIDLIDVYTEASALVVKPGNPHHVASLADVCGLKAAVTAGSFPQELIAKQSARCGDQPVTVLAFPSNSDSVNAIRSGRADFGLQTSGEAKYIAASMAGDEKNGLEVLTQKRYMQTYHAWGLDKQQAGLRDAIILVLQDMIRDGTYNAIFAKWHLNESELQTITYNNAARFENNLMDIN